MHVSGGVLITYAIAWSCGIVGFEEMLVLSASFFAKFWWRRFSKLTWDTYATLCVSKFSYLRNYYRYFLYICVIKRVKPTVSENKIRFKGIQKMRAQLRVSTNFLTIPRISDKTHTWHISGKNKQTNKQKKQTTTTKKKQKTKKKKKNIFCLFDSYCRPSFL